MHVVLVRGTAQSCTGWDRLSTALTGRGHLVSVVDLPTGRPDRPAADYAALTAERTTDAAEPPVIVAHSAAGLLLPALAQRLRPAHLVWLAAAVPDFKGGTSFADQIHANADEIFNPEWLTASLSPDAEPDPVIGAYFLFHDCDYATLRWALSTVEPLNLAGVYADPPTPLPPDVTSTVVVPREDRTLRPRWMRAAARERLGVEPTEIDGGHCPHVSRPGLLADLIEAGAGT